MLARQSTVLFVLLASTTAAFVRMPSGQSRASDRCDEHADEFYFEPTASCERCSEVPLMFENYAKWLENREPRGDPSTSPLSSPSSQPAADQLSSTTTGSSSDDQRSSSGRSANSNQKQERTRLAQAKLGGSNKTINVKEVSIFKSNPPVNYNSDMVGVALSRLINLQEEQEQEEERRSQGRSRSPLDREQDYYSEPTSLIEGQPAPADYLEQTSADSSSLDPIRTQTKEVTKFVSQFIRFQPAIGAGDTLFRVMDECRQQRNASACQMWSNLCVMTMYSYSDTPASLSASSQPSVAAADQYRHRHHYHANNNNNERDQDHHEQQQPPPLATSSATSSSARADYHYKQSGRANDGRKGFHANAANGWQHCKQFTQTSICNSLRDWHRQERKLSGADNALQSIYATIDEPFPGAAGGLPAAGQLVLRPNQPLQLLAYRYNFEGTLIGIDQFGPAEMERFCLKSAASRLSPAASFGQQAKRRRPLAAPFSSYFKFGRNMRLKACQLDEREASQLLAERQLNDTQFVDLYIAYPAGGGGGAAGGSMLVKPVPILLKNLLYNGNLINQKHSKDPSRWRLVHRFFYHALISTANLQRSAAAAAAAPSRSANLQNQQPDPEQQQQQQEDADVEYSLLYAKSVVLDLKFRKLDEGALLSSILLTIDYGIVARSLRDLASPAPAPAPAPRQNQSLAQSWAAFQQPSVVVVDTSLLVEQSLADMHTYKRDLDLAITILSILSSIWSLIRCYNVQKCHGSVKLDLESLVRFVIIGCDTVGLLLLVIMIVFITYLFVCLKFQRSTVQVLAPDEQLEASLMLNLQLAFVFKSIGLLHKLYVQLNADLFFIDWERPRMLTSSQILDLNYQHLSDETAIGGSNKSLLAPNQPQFRQNQHQHQQQVSFWRPYTVINRWFQMQTLRRVNLTLQLILFLLLVQVSRLSQFSSADSSLLSTDDSTVMDENKLSPRESFVFRALLLAYAYLGLASGQILYKKYLHEPWLRDSVREFVDLCSVANVSLMCWLYPRFGYYIHGRNANGSGDRSIGEMNSLLEREERDLCSKRGLAPNSDEQAFILILPKVINDHYRNLLAKEPASSLVHKLASSSQQPLAKQSRSSSNNNQPSSANNGRGLSPSPMAPSSVVASWRSRIDNMLAKHKSIQQFLANYLEHVYKDIDYTIREKRKLEAWLLLDFDLDEEASSVSMSTAGGAATSSSRSPILVASQPTILAASQQQQAHNISRHQAATFCKDRRNSFTALLWLGLELDLLLAELLLVMLLDFWLGQPALLITTSLVWFAHQAFRAAYVACCRYNLITKALIDEKFLFASQ